MRNFIIILLVTSININLTAQEINPGIVIDTLMCMDDPSESYSIYLPTSYNKQKEWPVLIGFEPAARGSLPVNKYHEFAEKYGFILLCSNNTKNGPWEPNINSANKMINDIFKRFNINKNRVYTYGFSGGGRLAAQYAMNNSNVKGIIDCGAGFPNSKMINTSFKFKFIGIIGLNDANYAELFMTKIKLDHLGMNNNIIYYEGDHGWPPKNEFERAIISLLIENQNQNTDINDFYIKNRKYISDIKDTTDIFILENYYDLLSQIEDKLDLDKIFRKKRNSLIESSGYKNLIFLEKESIKIEREIQKDIINEFSNIEYYPEQFDIGLWNQKIKEIEKFLEKKKITKRSEVRLKNFVSMNANGGYYFSSESNIKSKHCYIDVLILLYPQSYNLQYVKSKLYAKTGDIKLCLKHLKKAIELGFNEKNQITNDKVFDSINEDKRFKKLLEAI